VQSCRRIAASLDKLCTLAAKTCSCSSGVTMSATQGRVKDYQWFRMPSCVMMSIVYRALIR